MADTDWGALAGAAAQIGGGIAGQQMSQADRDKMLQLLREMQAKYAGISDPKFADVGADTVGPSALGDIRTDPRLMQQETEVDDALKNITDSGGLTLADRAAQAQLQDKLARHDSAGRAAIKNDLAARGALNSGAGLAMQLANQQDSTQRAADSARDISANAQKQALMALRDRYSNASGRDQQDYQRKAAAAEAADAIAQHNASARRNAGIYANGQQQQQFQNDVTKVNGSQAPTNALAGAYGDEAKRKAKLAAQTGDAASRYFYSTDDS